MGRRPKTLGTAFPSAASESATVAGLNLLRLYTANGDAPIPISKIAEVLGADENQIVGSCAKQWDKVGFHFHNDQFFPTDIKWRIDVLEELFEKFGGEVPLAVVNAAWGLPADSNRIYGLKESDDLPNIAIVNKIVVRDTAN
jgi:hypothetical protein